MKIIKPNTRLLPSLILDRHLLSHLAAAAIAAGTTLQARAQDDNLALNPAAVPINVVAATVPLGGTPGYMVVNPKDTFVYVSTYISSSSNYVISQIETTTDTVATFPLTGQPSGLAVTPNGKQLYVTLNVNTGGAVAILDASTGAVINTIDLTGGPNILQISPDGKYAYVPMSADGGSDIVVIDTATQKIKKSIPITSPPDAISVVFSPSGSVAYVTCFDLTTGAGGVVEIDTATLKITHTVSLDAFTILSIVNPATHDVWTVGNVSPAGGAFNAIEVIKGDKLIKALTPPDGIAIGYPAFTPNGKYAYVPEYKFNGTAYNYVYLMDTTTYKPVGTPIQVGNEPYFVQIAHNGRYAYVGNQMDDTISVIEISPTQ